MIKVSIILPMYNAEKYIKDTIYSVLNQTFKDIELIIVDDGSTDNSYEICKEIQQLDNRIVLEKIENKGVSNARNYGIEMAKGKYVMFIDSDDKYDINIVEKMVKGIESSDLLVCKFKELRPNGKIKFRNIKYNYEISENSHMINFLQKNNLFNVVWNKIYKKDIIIDNNIKFNTNISIAEDLEFNLKYIDKIGNIKYINEFLYIYRLGETGLNYKYQKDRIEIRKNIYKYQKEMFYKKGYDINLINNEYIKICLAELKQISYLRNKKLEKEKVKLIIKNQDRQRELLRIKTEGNIKQKILTIILSKQVFLTMIYKLIKCIF